MGNCSLKAVSDASVQVPNEKGPVRTRAAVVAAGRKTVEVLPVAGNGFWKVKLVINPKDLERILSEDVNTEALIQQMRNAANSTPTRRNRYVC